jgi:N6-L-threonylcarbamoyladenine synthase
VEPVVLGLETSCDETAAAVVRGPFRVLSSVIATQHDLHRRYAGVVPEIASRAHLERLVPVVRESLARAGVAPRDLDAVAVGHRPGLIGSLLVGTSAAKALAWSLGRPLIGVDHIAAHLHAGLLDRGAPPRPRRALGLVVSGGHTSLFLVESPLVVVLVGRTIDDALGEAFDKAAVILGMRYPGGPEIDRLSRDGDDRAVDFPVARLGPESLDFSFSGLKTAILYAARGAPGAARGAPALSPTRRADLAASFQRAAVSAVLQKLARALDRWPVEELRAGGGVCANSRLRRELEALAAARRIELVLPRMEYCVDNAAMIAGLAAVKFLAGRFDDWALAASTGSEIASGTVAV